MTSKARSALQAGHKERKHREAGHYYYQSISLNLFHRLIASYFLILTQEYLTCTVTATIIVQGNEAVPGENHTTIRRLLTDFCMYGHQGSLQELD